MEDLKRSNICGQEQLKIFHFGGKVGWLNDSNKHDTQSVLLSTLFLAYFVEQFNEERRQIRGMCGGRYIIKKT